MNLKFISVFDAKLLRKHHEEVLVNLSKIRNLWRYDYLRPIVREEMNWLMRFHRDIILTDRMDVLIALQKMEQSPITDVGSLLIDF